MTACAQAIRSRTSRSRGVSCSSPAKGARAPSPCLDPLERFASIAAQFPHVAFEPLAGSWPEAPAGLDVLVVSLEGGSTTAVEAGMRRLSVIWGRAFAGSGIELHFVPSRPKWWVPERWWTNRRSAQFLLTEYIKLVYTIM